MKFIHVSGVYTECNGEIKSADFYVNADKIVSFSVLSESARRLKVSCEGWSRPLIVEGNDTAFLEDCTGFTARMVTLFQLHSDMDVGLLKRYDMSFQYTCFKE